MNTITKHMKNCFISIPTTRASKRDPNTPYTPSKVSKDTPMCNQPNKCLNAMWVFPLSKDFPITLHNWTNLMLQGVHTLNCEWRVLLLSHPIVLGPSSSIGGGSAVIRLTVSTGYLFIRKTIS